MTKLLRERFERTVCDCRICQVPCRTMPGALAPEDLPIIAARLGTTPDDKTFLAEFFQASEGAMIAQRDDFGNVTTSRVPSLVPKLNPMGCVFLGADGRCKIHDVSPVGCALMDMHQDEATGLPRSHALVVAQMLSHETKDEYSQAVDYLFEIGQTAPPLNSRRGRMAAEVSRVEKEIQREQKDLKL